MLNWLKQKIGNWVVSSNKPEKTARKHAIWEQGPLYGSEIVLQNFLLVYGTTADLQTLFKDLQSSNWYANVNDHNLVRDDLLKTIVNQWPNIILGNGYELTFEKETNAEKWQELTKMLEFETLLNAAVKQMIWAGKAVVKFVGSADNFKLQLVQPLKIECSCDECIVIVTDYRRINDQEFLLKEVIAVGSITFLAFRREGSDWIRLFGLANSPWAYLMGPEGENFFMTSFDRKTAFVLRNNREFGDFFESTEEAVMLDQIASVIGWETGISKPLIYIPSRLVKKYPSGDYALPNLDALGNKFITEDAAETAVQKTSAELKGEKMSDIRVEQVSIRANELTMLSDFYTNKILQNAGISPATLGIDSGSQQEGYELNRARNYITTVNRNAKIAVFSNDLTYLIESILAFVYGIESKATITFHPWITASGLEKIEMAERIEGVFGIEKAVRNYYANELKNLTEAEQADFLQRIKDDKNAGAVVY